MHHESAKKYDVIIIGAGAAGLMCALHAGRRDRSVLLLEHSDKVGKKILISGGGRCNFTNLHATHENYLSSNPHFCRSALAGFNPYDFLEMVEEHKVAYHEKKDGQMFCDHSASNILNMLLDECQKLPITRLTSCQTHEAQKREQQYYVDTQKGVFSCDSLVIATGGLSIPKMGATDFGFRLAKEFGLKIRPTRAALVPITLGGDLNALCAKISGSSLKVSIKCGSKKFVDDMLFTHKGLSGPAILQISNYWSSSEKLSIDLCPDIDLETELKQHRNQGSKVQMHNFLATHLNKKMAKELAGHWFEDKRLCDCNDKELTSIAQRFKEWTFIPSGTEGYRIAEVTRGGVDTQGLSSKTMESKSSPGLYFIGEVLDVTGELGGFNFQWAWASAYAAAKVV